MIDIHYRNIGYPKTGTNWLWTQLMSHRQVDAKFHVGYKEFKGTDLQNYKKLYKDYKVSINLDTHLFCEDTDEHRFDHPNHIMEHTTHISIIFRNFYEVLNSLYNMDKNRNSNFNISQQDFIKTRAPLYFDIEKIHNKWKNCDVKYFFYDDLKNDPENFMSDICNFIGIQTSYKDIGTVFSTNITEQLKFDDADVIKYMNENISILENITNRKLTHWKKYT